MASNAYTVVCVLLLIAALTHVQAQWAHDDDDCRTPDRTAGVCQPIYDCRPILNYLNAARKPLSAADRQLLVSYQCGFDKNTVKVCCPSGPLQTSGSGGAGDALTQHRNYKLLPQKGCGSISSDDRILNGNITALNEFTWMVLLGYDTPSEKKAFRCGGTLINERYILTAAHCITNLGNKKLVVVRLGEHDIKLDPDCDTTSDGSEFCNDPVQDITIEQVIVHPEYNTKTFANDIGLIRLGRNADTTVDSVKPICLPLNPTVRNRSFKSAIVTGWGRTENTAQSNVLLKVELPVMEQTECKNRYQKIAQITERHICAGGVNEKDSCGGDSGGPMQVATPVGTDVRYVQYGVVSFGPTPCSTRGLPGVYTKIPQYLTWILDNIKP